MNGTQKALYSLSKFLYLSMPFSGSLSVSVDRVLGDVLVVPNLIAVKLFLNNSNCLNLNAGCLTSSHQLGFQEVDHAQVIGQVCDPRIRKVPRRSSVLKIRKDLMSCDCVDSVRKYCDFAASVSSTPPFKPSSEKVGFLDQATCVAPSCRIPQCYEYHQEFAIQRHRWYCFRPRSTCKLTVITRELQPCVCHMVIVPCTNSQQRLRTTR